MELIFLKPRMEDADLFVDYKKEFLISGDSIDGSSGLANYSNICDWIRHLEACADQETLEPSMVQSSTYAVFRKDDMKLIGMIDIRHELNDHLLQSGGHIGYSVRKSERCKGYAKLMLAIALEKCRQLKISDVLLTCSADNIASEKTIVANGGILENQIVVDGVAKKRFWISFDDKSKLK